MSDLPSFNLQGKIFESIRKFHRFRSDKIVANTIEFKENELIYSYSDCVFYGNVTFEDDKIIAWSQSSIDRIPRFVGKYDATTKHLIWENEEYIEFKKNEF